MIEPNVTGEPAIALTNLVRAIVLPVLLGALVWATWRLRRVRLGGQRRRQGDLS